MDTDLKTIQARVIDWAEFCPDLRALLVVGSQARRIRPADEWSDLDLMLFMAKTDPYLRDQDWIRKLGPMLVLISHETGDGDPELLVVFEGGAKVDFVFFRTDDLHEMVQAQRMPSVYHPGYRVLVDKDGLAAKLPPIPEKSTSMDPPSNQAFSTNVKTFWYGALYVAKQIRRGNLWVVKYRDWTMKELLLTMLTWHARAVQGWAQETWHEGHAMQDWLDEATWTELQEVFGRFSAQDSRQALLATTALYRRLAQEVAVRLNFKYPEDLDRNISELIDRLEPGK